jgi:tRNA1Val (adenine37-N6)-methyltransferase
MTKNRPLDREKVGVFSECCEPPSRSAEPAGVAPGAETLDVLFNGRLRVLQSRRGYRFSLDALLLAHFASPRGGEKVVDLGSGSGVVSLILGSRYPDLVVTGLEIQESMVSLAQRSARLNRLEGRVEFLQCDVRAVTRTWPPGGIGLVVCNPPYRRIGSGRISQEHERMIARHEVKAELKDFLRAGSYLLERKGKMVLIFLAGRLADLLEAMRSAGLEPKRLRFVHSSSSEPAGLVLVEGVKGARVGITTTPPLIVYGNDGRYGAEATKILQEDPN